jgi:hypothetical protein
MMNRDKENASFEKDLNKNIDTKIEKKGERNVEDTITTQFILDRTDGNLKDIFSCSFASYLHSRENKKIRCNANVTVRKEKITLVTFHLQYPIIH